MPCQWRHRERLHTHLRMAKRAAQQGDQPGDQQGDLQELPGDRWPGQAHRFAPEAGVCLGLLGAQKLTRGGLEMACSFSTEKLGFSL